MKMKVNTVGVQGGGNAFITPPPPPPLSDPEWFYL
jgi:hypothetical protein